MRRHFISLFLCVFIFSHQANAKVENEKHERRHITLATTSWCPYTCGERPGDFGFIGAYISAILSTLNVDLTIESYPWSRAIELANQGKVDGLLTATHEEAPNLLFTNQPISTYQMCFFTQRTNQWTYRSPLNLQENRLAVIQDYGYGEPLDSYIRQDPTIFQLSGSNGTHRLIDLLLKRRVDIIVEDTLVLNWVAGLNRLDLSSIKQSNCLQVNPFYLALNNNVSNKHLIEEMNEQFIQQENIQLLHQLIDVAFLSKRKGFPGIKQLLAGD